jgi:hypothetical protein
MHFDQLLKWNRGVPEQSKHSGMCQPSRDDGLFHPSQPQGQVGMGLVRQCSGLELNLIGADYEQRISARPQAKQIGHIRSEQRTEQDQLGMRRK